MSTPDDKQKLLKVNDSDKPRGILPETEGHSTDVQPTLLEKAKTHKWKIIAVVAVLLLAIILAIVFASKGGSDPEPTPPTPPNPPTPPIPPPTPNSGVNPYFVDNSTFGVTKYAAYGQLWFNNSVVNDTQMRQHISDSLIKLNPKDIPTGYNNNYTTNVSFEFGQVDFKIHKLKFTDALKEKFTPPEDLVLTKNASVEMSLDMVGFKLNQDPFGFELRSTRTENDTLVSISAESDFVMSDKFMQLDLQVPTQRIYGFGERQRQFSLDQGTWTMWANGRPQSYDDGTGGKQTYGVHPFALVQTSQKNEFIGMYFRNTNAASPIITHRNDTKGTISYITTGGQIEVFFFLKDNAKNVIKAYQNFVGKPSLPPFWALGWHASTTADPSTTLQTVQTMVNSYNTSGIPLESVWLDRSYMDNYKDFSVNSTTFNGLYDYTNTTLHNNNIKLGLVLGPSLSSTSEQDPLYSDAQQSNALINSFVYQGEAVTQTVWTGVNNTGSGHQNVFLDFFHTDGVRIWGNGLSNLYDLVPYDALSLENNEASGQCDGECPNGLAPPAPINETNNFFTKYPLEGPLTLEQSNRTNETWYFIYDDQNTESTYSLPFTPGMSPLDYLSLSLNATHPANGLSEYDVHSLFGHLEGKVTQEWLSQAQPDKRTFILSRSTFSGSGANVGHHLGENQQTWDDMKHSIAGVMNFNMFGVPLTGPETCGFFSTSGKAEDELCARWIQLATFYPLARQHRAADAPANEPYALQGDYMLMAKAAINDRLQYLRHLYTCLFETSQDGGSCFDPLLMHYPTDDNVFNVDKTENQFIVGSSIMVTPVLEAVAAGVTTMQAYFPKGAWVSLKDWSKIIQGNNQDETIDIPMGSDTVNAWLRPGHMIPFQPNTGDLKTTADVLSKAQTHLLVNRDEQGHAEGRIFIDKGISLSEINDKTYEYYEFHLSGNSLKKWIKNTAVTAQVGNGIDSVIITNAENLSTVDFACWVTTAGDYADMSFAYDATKKTQTISAKTGTIPTFALRDIYFGDSSKDINMCHPETNFYKYKGADIDLSSSHATTILTNNKPGALQDLTLELALLSKGAVKVMWKYANQPAGWKTPFTVPTDIVDPGTDYSQTAVLSDRVRVNKDGTTGEISIDILAADKTTPLYTIAGNMQLSQWYNSFRGTAHTRPTNFKGLMGLAEQTTSDLFLQDGIYSLWSLDTANPVETREAPGNNMYGTHPFLMGAAADSSWFGVFANLAAAQDWRITNNAQTGDVSVATMATGGVGDLRFIFGADPNELTAAYHESIVGKPVVTPQWALGWNQCRWGYRNTTDLQAVVDNYKTYNLSLDTMWSDIDYMQDYKVFTIDSVNFAGMKEFVDGLIANKMHWIPIIDPGVAQRLPSLGDNYPPYEDGINQDIFIKAANGEPITGSVWADDAVFPDWYNPKTQAYWSNWLNALRALAQFDGLWLDMNEVSNMLCTGVCYDSQKAEWPTQWNLPYIPTGRNLEEKSLSLDAVHTGGVTELDTHSLFGTQEVKATHDFFTNTIKQRAMIIERSAFAGMGKYGSRWLGDNFSTAEYMGYSITGIMAHNIAGIPLAGSDICGFIGNTNAELCARWYVVGAFYPFSRNHNSWDTIAQEPWNFDTVYEKSVTYLDIIRNAMKTKLHLIRYYYTQLSMVQTSGGAFYKPLFFEFPDEAGAYNDQELNIMLGSGVKLGVQSQNTGVDTTNFYFPAGLWCEIINRKGTDGCITQATSGTVATSSLAFEFALHLRAGHIIPMQDATTLFDSAGVRTTADLQAHPVDIHVLPLCDESKCTATGHYVNDDGLTLDMTQRNTYTMSYEQPPSVTPNTLTLTVSVDGKKAMINNNDHFGNFEIYNAKAYGMDTNSYTVSAMVGGTAVPLDDAVYVPSSDRLVASAGTTVVDLTQVTSITLTRKP